MKGEVAAAPAFTEKVCLCAIIQEHTQSRDTPRPGGTHTAGVKRVKEREREGSEVTLFGNLSLSLPLTVSLHLASLSRRPLTLCLKFL